MNYSLFALILASIFILNAPTYSNSQQLVTYSEYGETCSPNALLPTLCRKYEGTVKCSKEIQGSCVCNMGDDALFVEEWNLCVSKPGALCQMEKTLYSRKVCVSGADCIAQREGDGIGICKCLDGYSETDRTCIPIPGEAQSTPRATTTKVPLFPAQPSTSTEDPTTDDNDLTTKKNGACIFQITKGLIVVSMILRYFLQ